MSTRFRIIVPCLVLIAAGCGSGQSPGAGAGSATEAPGTESSYVSLDDDLIALIDDFNANRGKIRQIYIVGPTCGICLRGMTDMDEALVASEQDNPRLFTQVLHVPALGAEERHVEPTVHLIDGPRVRHYWDGSGHSGLEFQAALELPIYAWDVWLVYGPEAVWEHGNTPPQPEFWQHQLGGLGDEYAFKLDPVAFAAEVRSRMDRIDLESVADSPRPVSSSETAAGDVIRVEQPRGFIIQQHLSTRGGYRRLKNVASIRAEGSLRVGGREFPMTTLSDREGRHQRRVETPEGAAVSAVAEGTVTQEGPPLIPLALDEAVLRAFELHSWLLEWKDKGHQVWRLGMMRDGGRMPWLMEVEHSNGQTWHLYLDSHTGDDYRRVLLDERGEPVLTLELGDFKDVSGFRMAHSWSLFSNGETLAQARYTDIEVQVAEDSVDRAVGH